VLRVSGFSFSMTSALALGFLVQGDWSAQPIVFQGNGCQNLAYPEPHQPGQNFDGNKQLTDPIYLWGNTGPAWGLGEDDDCGWANNCANHVWSDFFQWGRDGVNPSLRNGNPRPGYTAYTYPHPLAQ
jgi:hypothetical protein